MNDDSWKGEHLIHVPRNPDAGRGLNMKTRKINGRLAARIARREKVVVLHETGMTPTDIGATIGCSHSAVRSDLIAMGMWQRKSEDRECS